MRTNVVSSAISADTSSPSSGLKGFTVVRVVQVLAGLGAMLVLIAALLPAVTRSREPQRRAQCKKNLQQIGLALRSYHDKWGSFPPAYTVDNQGKRLHSWRTLLLPFLREQHLYDMIDLSKPWDDAANAVARLDRCSEIFVCPSCPVGRHFSSYLAVSVPTSCFPGSETRKLKDMRDGPSNVLAVIDVSAAYAVEQMQPTDLDEEAFKALLQEKSICHHGIIHVLLADGTFRAIPKSTEAQTLRSLVTIAGGEKPGAF